MYVHLNGQLALKPIARIMYRATTLSGCRVKISNECINQYCYTACNQLFVTTDGAINQYLFSPLIAIVVQFLLLTKC